MSEPIKANPSPVHHLLTDEDCEKFLLEELRRAYPKHRHDIVADSWVRTDAPVTAPLAFCRQALPHSSLQHLPSINNWAEAILQACLANLAPDQPWRLHVEPCYGEGNAGLNRCELIVKALRDRLQKKRRSLLRSLVTSSAPWAVGESLVQVCLLEPEKGILSVCAAQEYRHTVWPFPKGELPVAVDRAAPSRAFSKLVEAEQRLGIRIDSGDSVVDLGAAPGSWSYIAMQRGANVVSVDRSELREDLMKSPQVSFVKADAFKYKPEQSVDWLICDIIAAPQRSIELLLEWLRAGLAKRFIVSIKFMGTDEYPRIDELKAALPELCSEFYLTRLCANKNEVCAFGLSDYMV